MLDQQVAQQPVVARVDPREPARSGRVHSRALGLGVPEGVVVAGVPKM